ncbi:uncharacterized protein LOC142337954 [Convolutriloba macropyga]|uniref:uncharacterized protein LOC142337954 n=1 Tax=Convolutriloba macropyga TaxID=536237 RepID=UPI003F51D745
MKGCNSIKTFYLSVIASLILWCCCHWAFVGAAFSPGWQSLEFQLPDDTQYGKMCAELSDHFCLKGFFIPRIKRYRHPGYYDRDNFIRLIEPMHQHINFFSFYQHRFGSCCAYQARIYMNHGQGMGLSPQSYFNSLTDFSSRHRDLNFIKVISIPNSSEDEIYQRDISDYEQGAVEEEEEEKETDYETDKQIEASGLRNPNPNSLLERIELLILETKPGHDGLNDEMGPYTSTL